MTILCQPSARIHSRSDCEINSMLRINCRDIHGLRAEYLPWLKRSRREVRPVWRIGEMLCLQAEGRYASSLGSGWRSRETRDVKLQAGLVRNHL